MTHTAILGGVEMSQQDSRTQQAAAYIAQQVEAREPIDIMAEAFVPRTIEEAYAVQSAVLNILAETKGPIGGYKIASTNPASRQRTGVSGPCAAGIFARQISNAPATLSSADYHQFCIECEVGVRLAANLDAAGAPYTRSSVAGAIDSLASRRSINSNETANESMAPASLFRVYGAPATSRFAARRTPTSHSIQH